MIKEFVILKKYILYLIRWQFSTPILAICCSVLLAKCGTLWTTVIANFIGGLIFFWIDKFIFDFKDNSGTNKDGM